MAEMDWRKVVRMIKVTLLALMLLLILLTGCSSYSTNPTGLAEMSPTTPVPTAATPTTALPTSTPEMLQTEDREQVEETSEVVEPKAAVQEKKPGLFFFYAEWCSACSEMRPVIEKLEKEYSDRIRFVMVDVDDPEARELVSIAGVRAIPLTIFVTSPDGQAQQWVGARPESDLREAFDEALK
jgi:thioredoxin-like negative regulator of GroEL